jgi:hypothetical protein
MTSTNTPNPYLGLTVFPMKDCYGWAEQVETAAKKLGYAYRRSQSRVLIWRPEDLVAFGGFVPAWRVGRETFSHDQAGLGIKSVRAHIGTDGNPKVESTPFGKPPPVGFLMPAERIRSALHFGRELSSVIENMSKAPLRLPITFLELEKASSFMVGNGQLVEANPQPWNDLRKHGFLSVPDNFRIFLFADDPTDLRGYVENLRDAMKDYGVNGSVEPRSFQSLINRLTSKSRSSAPNSLCGWSILVAAKGRGGDKLTSREKTVFRCLRKHRIPYRIYSLRNGQPRHSALNQIADLVRLAGGKPYELDLPKLGQGIENLYYVGVDLGHPLGSASSILAVSLCDSKGTLIRAWRMTQPKDETARLPALQRILGEVRKQTNRISSGTPSYFVLRDGRLHSGESVPDYRSCLSTHLTFADLSKRPCCHFFSIGADGLPVPAPPGSCGTIKGSEFAYFISSPPPFSHAMPNLQKVRFRDDWDEIGIGLRRTSEILVGLSYAPCLGLKPHRSPSPIHWADGFAGSASLCSRFGGWPCTHLRQERFSGINQHS